MEKHAFINCRYRVYEARLHMDDSYYKYDFSECRLLFNKLQITKHLHRHNFNTSLYSSSASLSSLSLLVLSISSAGPCSNTLPLPSTRQ